MPLPSIQIDIEETILVVLPCSIFPISSTNEPVVFDFPISYTKPQSPKNELFSAATTL